MRNHLFTAILLGCAFAAPVAAAPAATVITDPAKFVTENYARIAKNPDYQTPDDVYSPRLAALFALDSKEAGGEVGRLDFDPWTNAQDFKLSSVKVTSSPVESAPDRETVVAKFKNIGSAEEIHFYFERTKAGWKIDDMRSAAGQMWTLSLILKYGWDDAK